MLEGKLLCACLINDSAVKLFSCGHERQPADTLRPEVAASYIVILGRWRVVTTTPLLIRP